MISLGIYAIYVGYTIHQFKNHRRLINIFNTNLGHYYNNESSQDKSRECDEQCMNNHEVKKLLETQISLND